VPADATLLDSQAAFAESLLTGESHPVPKQAGDAVYAGTLCADRGTRLRVLRTGAATRLAELARLVDRAQRHRPRAARLADRVASRFVVALLVASTLVFVAWRIVDPSRALEVTLALLVVSCPCALSLAVPAVLAAAHGRLSGLGILVARADALETLARVTDVVFDKTGTLTDGHLVLASVATMPAAAAHADLADTRGGGDTGGARCDAFATGIAAALAAGSRHPVAQAFADAPRAVTATDVAEFAGRGLEGTVGGHRYRLGQASFAGGAPVAGAARAAEDDAKVCLASWQHGTWTTIARFGLAERLRPDAAAALAALRDAGLTVHLCSGDAAGAVASVSRALGIEHGASRRTPADKLAYLRAPAASGPRRGDDRRRAQRCAGAGRRRRLRGDARRRRPRAAGRGHRAAAPGAGLRRLGRAGRAPRAARDAAERRVGDRLQRGRPAARSRRPGHAMDRRARDGHFFPHRHPQRAAPRAGNAPLNILLLLIPLSLMLLVAAIGAFAWAVRHGQFEDLDTPALDILAQDPSHPSTQAPRDDT
jgi:P-type Cu2+ transporter